MSLGEALLRLIGSADLSRALGLGAVRSLILGNTVQRPGGDAAVVRIGDGPKGLALTADVTPRYCEADPVRGRQAGGGGGLAQYHAPSARRPLAVTDNLNFGNPERPETMGQLVGCIARHRRGLPGARFPHRLGQRLALQRDQGPRHPADADDRRRRPGRRRHHGRDIAFKAPGEEVLLIGGATGWLGQSIYLREICGREEGAPPPVDLAAERRNGEFVARLIRAGKVSAVPRSLRRRAPGRARRNGDGRAASAPSSSAGRRHRRRTLSGSARIRPAMS